MPAEKHFGVMVIFPGVKMQIRLELRLMIV